MGDFVVYLQKLKGCHFLYFFLNRRSSICMKLERIRIENT